jgi:hypothetical protein
MGPQRGPHERRVGLPHPDRWRAMNAQCGKGCGCDESFCLIKIYAELYGVKDTTENEVS